MLEGKDFIILTDQEAKLVHWAANKYIASLKKGDTANPDNYAIADLCREIRGHFNNTLT